MSNEGMHHITPFSTYAKVGLSLIVLTALTVICYRLDLGVMAAPVAILIATTKAALVIMYFMHMKYDSKINRLIFGSAFFFVGVLFFFSVVDIFTRIAHHPNLNN